MKFVKDSDSKENDWWHNLSDEVKAGIERGLADVDAGRVVSHEEVKKKYLSELAQKYKEGVTTENYDQQGKLIKRVIVNKAGIANEGLCSNSR